MRKVTFSNNPAILTTRNNGTLYSRSAMPFKPATMTNESGFSTDRAAWRRTSSSLPPANASAPASASKRWFSQTGRDASTNTARVRLSATGAASSSPASASTTFVGGVHKSLQTQRQALLRTRNAGSALGSRSQAAQIK